MLKAKYPNILIWITCSLGFNGSRAYVRAGKHDLFQGTTSPLKGACDKKFLGVDCDFDEANNPNWGWFVPWGNSTPEPTPPPPLSRTTSSGCKAFCKIRHTVTMATSTASSAR